MTIRATPRQMIGLSIATTAGMFGIVFALNMEIYGWAAGVVGAMAVPVATVAGIRLHRSSGDSRVSAGLQTTETSNGETDT